MVMQRTTSMTQRNMNHTRCAALTRLGLDYIGLIPWQLVAIPTAPPISIVDRVDNFVLHSDIIAL